MDERDDKLAEHIRKVIGDLPEMVEKRMFGGMGFLVRGNMACGVNRGSLIVRVGPDEYAEALAQPHVRPFDMTGRPMKGWIVVDPDGYKTSRTLRRWVERGVAFALTLPAK